MLLTSTYTLTHEMHMIRTQAWFELRDLQRRTFDTSAWTVLRASRTTSKGDKRFSEGYEEETFAAATASFSLIHRVYVEGAVNWGNLSLNDHAPYIQDDRYLSADWFDLHDGDVRGTNLILSQRGNRLERSEWHVHADLVLGLSLKREGDEWLAIDEGYVPVIRLSRDGEGSPNLIEIRTGHLKDFLAARNEFLAVSTYNDRELIVADQSIVQWNSNPIEEKQGTCRWQGSVTAITESGHPLGSSMAILMLEGRTSILSRMFHKLDFGMSLRPRLLQEHWIAVRHCSEFGANYGRWISLRLVNRASAFVVTESPPRSTFSRMRQRNGRAQTN